jgi:hypothetical protein
MEIRKMLKRDLDIVIMVDGRERCQPKGNNVLMADGSWKDISEIQIGDVVISPQKDGTTIFAKVARTYQYDNCQIYSICELYKQHTELYSCSGQHNIPIWKVVDKHRINGTDKRTKGNWELQYLPAEYYSQLNIHKKMNMTTMLSPPIEKFLGRENCLVEPYTLGAWLGDGTWGGNKHGAIAICSNDQEIITEIDKFYKIGRVGNKNGTTCKDYHFPTETGLRALLAHYGLANTKSGTKFIPKQALLSDMNYRMRLLAGLIDTDGYYGKGGYSITTKSEKLANGILELVRSLGGIGRVMPTTKGINKGKYAGFIGHYFNVNFRCLDLPILVKHKQRTGNIWYKSTNRCAIDAKTTGGFATVYGIELDSPSQLYITNNYAVTHNSGKSLLAQQIAYFLDPTFNIERISFTGHQFKDNLKACTKGQAIILDEAMNVLFSRQAMRGENVDMIKVLAQVGQKNLVMIIVLPSFFDLDKYVAVHRGTVLITVKMDNGRRGDFEYRNRNEIKDLYLRGKATENHNASRPHFKGKFTNYYVVDEAEYRRKKVDSLENDLSDKEKKKLDPIKQMVRRLHHDGLSEGKIFKELDRLGNHRSGATIHKYIHELDGLIGDDLDKPVIRRTNHKVN